MADHSFDTPTGCDALWDALKARGFTVANLELANSMVEQSSKKYGEDSSNLALSADVKVAVSDWRSAVDCLAFVCEIDLTTTPATLRKTNTKEAARRFKLLRERVAELTIQCDEPSEWVDVDGDVGDAQLKPPTPTPARTNGAKIPPSLAPPPSTLSPPRARTGPPEYRLRILWRYFQGKSGVPDSLLHAEDIGGMYEQFIRRMKQEGLDRTLSPASLANLATKKFALGELKSVIYGETGLLRALGLCDHLLQIEANMSTRPGDKPDWRVPAQLAQGWDCVCTLCRNGAHVCDRQCWRRRPATALSAAGTTATVESGQGRRRAYSDMSEGAMSVEYYSAAAQVAGTVPPRPRAVSDVFLSDEQMVHDVFVQKRTWDTRCECCCEERQNKTGDAKLMHCIEPGCVKSFHKRPCSHYEKFKSGLVKVYCRQHLPKCEGCKSYKQPETNDCSLMRCCEDSCRRYFHKAPCSPYDKFRSGCIRVFCLEHYDMHQIGQRRRASSFAGLPISTTGSSPVAEGKRRKMSLTSPPQAAARPGSAYKGASSEPPTRMEQEVASVLLLLKQG